MPPLLRSAIALAFFLVAPFSRGADEPALPAGFVHWEFPVDGAQREVFVYAPPTAKTKAAPVVFVFHGHGGTARSSARGLPMHRT